MVTVDCTGEMPGGGEEDGEVLVDVFMSIPPTSTSFSAGDGGGVVAWDAGAWRCSCASRQREATGKGEAGGAGEAGETLRRPKPV
jgi:hypothetical protein